MNFIFVFKPAFYDTTLYPISTYYTLNSQQTQRLNCCKYIFGNVIETGIGIIGQCHSLSGVFSNFIAIRDRRHCEMRLTEIHKRRILDNDGITMKCLDTDLLDVIQIINESLSYVPSIAAIVKLMSEGYVSTTFSVLIIKRLYLMTTIIQLYKSSHQCNKYLYYFITSLSKNSYGTDTAPGKLWLATILLHQGDNDGSLQNVNDVLSSIPPYALYFSCTVIMSGDDSKQLYVDRYCGRNTEILCRAKEAWLFDMHITHSEYSFVPRAIQIELDHCDPITGVRISPFTYAYYLMFMCYHGLGQYDDRDRALRQLVDTVSDNERCGVRRYHSYNIAGHCLLMAGYVEMAWDMFLESARFTRPSSVLDKYNAVYKYL